MLVIKVGGSKGIDLDLFARDLATLHQRERIVLVHGANYELDQFMRRVGVEPRLVRPHARHQACREGDQLRLAEPSCDESLDLGRIDLRILLHHVEHLQGDLAASGSSRHGRRRTPGAGPDGSRRRRASG